MAITGSPAKNCGFEKKQIGELFLRKRNITEGNNIFLFPFYIFTA